MPSINGEEGRMVTITKDFPKLINNSKSFAQYYNTFFTSFIQWLSVLSNIHPQYIVLTTGSCSGQFLLKIEIENRKKQDFYWKWQAVKICHSSRICPNLLVTDLNHVIPCSLTRLTQMLMDSGHLTGSRLRQSTTNWSKIPPGPQRKFPGPGARGIYGPHNK